MATNLDTGLPQPDQCGTDGAAACTRVDVLIVGAGPVGMTLALALRESGLRIVLVDRQTRAAHQGDPRALALSHGARQLLAQIEGWPHRQATAIETIHVSQRGGFGRTLMDRQDYDLPALGYVVRYRDLAGKLHQALQAAITMTQGRITLLEGTEVEGAEAIPAEAGAVAPTDTSAIAVTLRQGGQRHHYQTRLLVHAEGTPFDDPAVTVSDYRQHAIITEVKTRPGHGNRAWERFTPDGPLALLPLGDEFSIVFTVPPERAEHLLALDDAAFLAALQHQFADSRLQFVAAGPRHRFPLALRMRDSLTARREVWIGNTAQTLHPVSGQGFNLGLRDAWQLADLLRRCADPGDPARLEQYARQRKLDREGSAWFTDGIVRLFSSDLPPLRVARGLGLLALDLFAPARHFVARRMIWGARAWF